MGAAARSRREIQALNVSRATAKIGHDLSQAGAPTLMSEPRIQSELDVLTAVEQGVVVTQATLTKRIGISIGLINALLKRAILKGYVKTRQAPYKRYAYYLTPEGFAKKSRLVTEYLDHSLRFFRSARSEYAELVAAASKAGMTRLVLVGSGELAEIAVLAAWGEDVTLIGVIDPNANEARRYGLNVLRSLDEARPLRCRCHYRCQGTAADL